MHFAASGGMRDIVNLLLSGKGDATIANSDRTTPLFFAASDGHVEAATAIIESFSAKHQNVNAKNNVHVFGG